jgi:NAD/NADP transhydrogenase beta subunit
MNVPVALLIDAGVIVLLLLGAQRFRSPRGAVAGNSIAAVAVALAVLAVGLRHEILSPALVVGLVVAGAAIGCIVAIRVSMIQTPAMVAFQHGAGALAAFLVCFIELVRQAGEVGTVQTASGITGLVLGGATLTGSLVAAGKLANLMSQPPKIVWGHDVWLGGVAIAVLGLAILAGGAGMVPLLLALLLLAGIGGLLVSIRVGGADMPVLISFLNATAGLAAAFAGVVIGNRLLVAAGATVAASGSVLTIAMCRAMNRRLLTVFIGTAKPSAANTAAVGWPPALAATEGATDGAVPDSGSAPDRGDPFDRVLAAFRDARSVIFIPGYGMAMAQAQFEVVELARRFEAQGKTVRFAVHPVAGRMPGHMHVLLSEADAPWDKLRELDVNPEFAETDLAVVVGASDVVNPAAATLEGTPISRMPILEAHRARHVVVINLDDRPGYSGVHNQLYDMEHVVLLWGDAKASLRRLLEALAKEPEPAPEPLGT